MQEQQTAAAQIRACIAGNLGRVPLAFRPAIGPALEHIGRELGQIIEDMDRRIMELEIRTYEGGEHAKAD